MKPPKEEAIELMELFYDALPLSSRFESIAKQCATITVKKIINAIDWHEFETPNKELEYWNEVLKEIEKL